MHMWNKHTMWCAFYMLPMLPSVSAIPLDLDHAETVSKKCAKRIATLLLPQLLWTLHCITVWVFTANCWRRVEQSVQSHEVGQLKESWTSAEHGNVVLDLWIPRYLVASGALDYTDSYGEAGYVFARRNMLSGLAWTLAWTCLDFGKPAAKSFIEPHSKSAVMPLAHWQRLRRCMTSAG